jgi:hypothetical protein
MTERDVNSEDAEATRMEKCDLNSPDGIIDRVKKRRTTMDFGQVMLVLFLFLFLFDGRLLLLLLLLLFSSPCFPFSFIVVTTQHSLSRFMFTQ